MRLLKAMDTCVRVILFGIIFAGAALVLVPTLGALALVHFVKWTKGAA